MLDTEISLCKFWDVQNKNIPWGHFPESIHSFLFTDLERHIHLHTNHWAGVQDAGTREAVRGRRVFADRKGPCPALSPLSKPCSGVPSWGMQQESHSSTPSLRVYTPAHLSEEACDPCLAWAMLLSVLLLVLWMGEEKKTNHGHPWHGTRSLPEPSALPHAQPGETPARRAPGFINGSATNVHHGSILAHVRG